MQQTYGVTVGIHIAQKNKHKPDLQNIYRTKKNKVAMSYWFMYHSSILCIQVELHYLLQILVKDKLFTSVCVVHKSTDWVC